jgi:adenylosuccinate synthase
MYPFVTSSSPTAGGACTGTGVGPKRIDRVLGVAKAYITRVGSGPFPTELDNCPGSVGELLTRVGGEYGTTTGRQRRCGWYDGVIVRYAARVNGLTDLVITKLDVLSELDTIKVCVAYEYEGHRFNDLPCHQTAFHHAKPIYEELPGWKTDITACRTYEELPKAAQDYIAFIEDLAEVPVSMIAVGPDRAQTIMRRWEVRP